MIFEVAEAAKKITSKYSDNFEIYLEKEEVIQLDSENNTLNFAKKENNIGIGIRIINDNRLGFAYTSDIGSLSSKNKNKNKNEDRDTSNLAITAENAFLNSKLNEKDPNFAFAEPSKYPKIKGIYDSKFNKFDLDEATDFMNIILNTVDDEDCEATSGGFSAVLSESIIINSNEVNCYNKSTGFSTYIAVNAEKNDEKSTAYDSQSSCKFDLNPTKLGKDVCKIAKDSIGGFKIKTSNEKVILDYHAATGLLNTFLMAFSGDNVQRGRSLLADKLEKDIVSHNLSIYDDATYEGGLYSSPSDNEGTISQKTNLVKEGKLKNFIYDIYTANKVNKLKSDENKNDFDIKSTGNGFRGSYSSVPSISPSNVIFDFSDKVTIEEIDKGFLATDVLGAHTANPISGDFSVEANNAFIIENGEITKPVKKAMLSGNIFQGLSECIAIDSEIRQYGSFIIPKIMFNNLRIVA